MSARPSPTPEVRRARTAVYTVFSLNGLTLATWLSRVPHVRDQLELTPGELGQLLLAIAVGSMCALPTSGAVIARAGATRTVAGGSVVAGIGLCLAGLGAGLATDVAVTAIGLVLLGLGSGAWDVAMNVEAAAVEKHLAYTIMPRFHAAFSLGTVIGAGVGTSMSGLQIPVHVHLVAVGVPVLLGCAVASRAFLPAAAPETDGDKAAPDAQPRYSVLRAWTEPRTLLVGVLVLAFALTEGIANDWLAVALVDGYRTSETIGTAGLALFMTAMTIARFFGTLALDRWGRVVVLRTVAGCALAGVLLVVFGGSLWVAGGGIVLWGIGAALGFPLGMTAASDDPVKAPARVSVVASIGYTSFLAGPPLLGTLGDHHGVRLSLLVVAAAMTVGALVAAATRAPAQVPARTSPTS